MCQKKRCLGASQQLRGVVMQKAIFHGEVCKMLNADSHYLSGMSGNTNRTLTEAEMNTFVGHLWEMFETHSSTVDETKLALMLIRTAGRYKSYQDQAAAIGRVLRSEER